MQHASFHTALSGADQASTIFVAALALLSLILALVGSAVFRSSDLARRAAPFLLLATAISGISVAVVGPELSVKLGWGTSLAPFGLSVGLGVDRVGGAMVALVGFLGWAIYRFASTYLRAERRRLPFLQRVVWTVVSVQLFALSTSLLTHALLWLAISVNVHWLLRHYDERPRARLAARKKFLISRAADLLLAGSLALLYAEVGTLDLSELARVEGGAPGLDLALVGLTLAALAKSAQFPFHNWLPETLDAPTPVSALMHAGVINAGAFLLLRVSPLLAESTIALTVLVVVGGFTAVFGTLVGVLQPNVKVGLAYSTIAQMGFLFLELGLGFVGAAALHLVAHALYKAHAFLRSGTPQRRAAPTSRSTFSVVAKMGASVLVLGSLLSAGAHLLGTDPFAYAPLAFLWALGGAQYLLSPHPSGSLGRWRSYLLMGGGLAAVALFAETLLAHAFAELPALVGRAPLAVATALVVLAALAAVMVIATRAKFDTPALTKLYVYARSGFYLGEITDQWTVALWPGNPDSHLHPTATLK